MADLTTPIEHREQANKLLPEIARLGVQVCRMRTQEITDAILKASDSAVVAFAHDIALTIENRDGLQVPQREVIGTVIEALALRCVTSPFGGGVSYQVAPPISISLNAMATSAMKERSTGKRNGK